MKAHGLIVFLALVTGLSARTVVLRSNQVAVPTFKNLQVLPDDTSRTELLDTMKRVAKSLGVECNFCHRTDKPDFASDEIAHKRTARTMMRMVGRLNDEWLTWQGAPRATCYMCHRGKRKPVMELPRAAPAR